MVFRVVDLPAPLAPIRVTTLDRVDGAVVYVQVLHLQQGQVLLLGNSILIDLAHLQPSFFLPR